MQRQVIQKEDYILSFWVQGVSVFVTDIHADSYKDLEVLYLIDQGTLKQYFTKTAYARALERGLAFYQSPSAFTEYQTTLSAHGSTLAAFTRSHMSGKERLTRADVSTFFEYTKRLCGDYAKMNIEYTDKAFTEQHTNPIIQQNLAGVAQFKDHIRGIMNTILFEPNGDADELFRILSQQFTVPKNVLMECTQRELLDLFEGKQPDPQIALKRQEAFVEGEAVHGYCEGEEAKKIIQQFMETVPTSNRIQGQTANGGKVTGTVKRIPVDYSNLERIRAEIENMQQGDILVAETTAPEVTLACKKAAAIITDMGGLMSHAAIISREFSIPCIVGTQNASKILKDGDRVEVNADAGIVTILNKK